jgi:hypothetical protein
MGLKFEGLNVEAVYDRRVEKLPGLTAFILTVSSGEYSMNYRYYANATQITDDPDGFAEPELSEYGHFMGLSCFLDQLPDENILGLCPSDNIWISDCITRKFIKNYPILGTNI